MRNYCKNTKDPESIYTQGRIAFEFEFQLTHSMAVHTRKAAIDRSYGTDGEHLPRELAHSAGQSRRQVDRTGPGGHCGLNPTHGAKLKCVWPPHT